MAIVFGDKVRDSDYDTVRVIVRCFVFGANIVCRLVFVPLNDLDSAVESGNHLYFSNALGSRNDH